MALREIQISLVGAYDGRPNVSPHTDKLIPSLVERGYNIHFVGWDRMSTRGRREDANGVTYEMVLRGGGFASRKAGIMLPVFWLRTAWTLLRSPRRLMMAIDFEAAVPVAVVSALTRQPFVYNCRDNIGLRPTFPRPLRKLVIAVDRLIMGRAQLVIVPDESRIPSRTPQAKFLVVENCAPDVAVPDCRDPAWLTVYAMGYLRESRGVGLLLDAASALPFVRVIAAGKCPEPALHRRLTTTANVDYRGELSMETALRLCGYADAVFTFYCPDTEINRLAASNKWSDAMMAARAIVVNREVQKAKWIVEQGIGVATSYDRSALVDTLAWMYHNREAVYSMGLAGRALYESGRNWPAMMERIVGALEPLCNAAASPE